METSGGLEDVEARTEIKMVCISEDYLCTDILLEVTMIYAFDRPDCPYGHKNRGLDGPV